MTHRQTTGVAAYFAAAPNTKFVKSKTIKLVLDHSNNCCRHFGSVEMQSASVRYQMITHAMHGAPFKELQGFSALIKGCTRIGPVNLSI